MSALAAVPLLLPTLPTAARSLEPETSLPPAPLGRIATWWRQAVRVEPAPQADVVRWMSRDELLPLHASVEGEPPWPTNPIWYQTDDGYIHSGYVQPVQDNPQPVIEQVPEPGFWGQVSVPWAEARWSPQSAYRAFKFYYGTVYRVTRTVYDEGGQAWYQLKEGVTPYSDNGPYVPAHTLRRVSPESLAPISPGHPDKTVHIDRQAQSLTCLEGDRAVFTTPASTGHAATPTPRGEFRVLYKRHTRRMTVQNIEDPYDLPGVPWTVYFTWSGVAIHGTYWHNDYGRVHSHGCVNLTPDAAQWVFRWAEPTIPYEAYMQAAEPPVAGTRVVVA
jgi:lipoprotein-anchoring transpeptidase ErfK/SrfK